MVVRASSPCVNRAAFLLSALFSRLRSISCTSKTPPPVEKVTVAVPANLYGAFFHVAQGKGFFREEGLDVALHIHPYGKMDTNVRHEVRIAGA